MSHALEYRKLVVNSHWSIVFGLWLLVFGCWREVVYRLSMGNFRWLGAADADFDCFGANAWPLHSENAKICYQTQKISRLVA